MKFKRMAMVMSYHIDCGLVHSVLLLIPTPRCPREFERFFGIGYSSVGPIKFLEIEVISSSVSTPLFAGLVSNSSRVIVKNRMWLKTAIRT